MTEEIKRNAQVFTTIDSRRRLKNNDESITPTEALKIAREVLSTFETERFKQHVRHLKKDLTPGDRILELILVNPETSLNLDLTRERRNVRELPTQTIYNLLESYKRRDIEFLNPVLVAAAEDCVRRLAGNAGKQ